MAGTFGVGAPFTQFAQTSPWGISPYGSQGLSINPSALQQLYGQPFGNLPLSPYAAQPLQQVVQLLQLVPQQLQQLEHLQLHQLQQLQQLQQLVQLVPAQVAQLQQLTQFPLRQIQQPTQLQQPFGQIPGLASSMTLPWGINPQIAGAQPGQVM